jgi:acyl-CoA dehydrogenase
MELPGYDFLSLLPTWVGIILVIVALIAMGFKGAGIRPWVLAVAVVLYGFGAAGFLWIGLAVVALLFAVPPVRRILSGVIMRLLDRMNFLPAISKTEQEAIDAGTVWIEGELFSGKPDFNRILAEPYPGLSDVEQAFMDGPVQELCEAVDDWDVFRRKDLPPEGWDLLRKHKFFGMIIPREYGGHGFSASANSAVVGKVSASNAVLGITVMVPNSLGPAELLIHYGTEAQKNHYLPRLASHEDIPAFALTEPAAGSDAGAISASGVVFRSDDSTLSLRLNWNKRYITLSPISTVLGLAFKLFDPENLLGKGTDLGITCALIPTDTEGVDNGHRHDPMGIPFYNGPTYGHDVVVPLEDAVIGGLDGIGRGWRMLMESLSAGRGISLPATSTYGTKMVARTASAHAVVRKQFGLSIGKFEGIEEPLARLAGFSYILEAARRYTNGGLDEGAKPAVVTAIMKYNATELFRKAINDGMDILGGNAISRGPKNLLANAYVNNPIGITVEGANILTRTLMIFGQGAIRSHPWVLKEIEALQTKNVRAFDRAFWGHVGLVFRNSVRMKLLGLTRGHLASAPVSGPTAKYYRKLAWVSATFSFWADMSMAFLGGDLKRKEKLTGRFADIFSWMYLSSAVLRRYEAEGRLSEDLPFVDWSMQYAFTEIQRAFEGVFANLRIPGFSFLLRTLVASLVRVSRFSTQPSDALSHRLAVAIQTPGEQRDRITPGIFHPDRETHPRAQLERAMLLSLEADDVVKKIKKAVRAGDLKKAPVSELITSARDAGIINSDEANLIAEAERVRWETIQVDSFTLAEYLENAVVPAAENGGNSERPVFVQDV